MLCAPIARNHVFEQAWPDEASDPEDLRWAEELHRPTDFRRASDADVVRGICADSEMAWVEAVSRFGPLVAAACRRCGLGHADVADAVQATWLRLARSCHTIREPKRVRGWLVRTAQRESIRVSVRSARTLAIDTTDELERRLPVAPPSDAAIVTGELSNDLQQAFGRLAPPYQRLLALLMRDDRLSYEEVAAKLGIALGSVGPMRQRALRLLRADLNRTGVAA